MTKKDGKRRRIVIDAFSGKILKSGFEPIDKNPLTVSEKLLLIEQERLRAEAEQNARADAAKREATRRASLESLNNQLTQPAQPVQPVATPPPAIVIQPVKRPQTRTRAS